MAKSKGPTVQQMIDAPEAVERREYTGRPGRSTFGRSTAILDCPFCGREVEAYLWSLAGGGKRCECGAFFGSTGTATHWASQNRQNEGPES